MHYGESSKLDHLLSLFSGLESEHWLRTFMEDLLEQGRASCEINFETVRRLLEYWRTTGQDTECTELSGNARLKQELPATREYLQSIIEEQEASAEELKSANEEVPASNKELETSKEELQSANEELNTLNDALKVRNADLADVNADLTECAGRH
jgi:chromosome segregation ATPase